MRPFTMQGLEYVREAERSKELNFINYPAIIISASGMCEAGRIRHHLKNNISDPKNSVLIVGFQAENTLGRRLVDKVPEVRIFGQPVARRCEVKILNAFSAHAGGSELFDNIKNSNAKKVICVHGEQASVDFLAARARDELKIEAVVPAEGIAFEI